MVIEATCPACGSRLRRWVHVPFVVFRMYCECGEPIIAQNPRIPAEYVKKARRCLDCGDPIAPVVPRGRVPRIAGRLPHPDPWVCASCWERHRVDEPGTDLDLELRQWLKGRPPVSRSIPTTRRT